MTTKNKIGIWLLLFLFLANTSGFTQVELAVTTPTPQEIEKIPLSEKISLDYKDADIINVIRSLSYTYGLNLVTSTEVKGKITISLKDVTLAEALDAVLSANGYNYSSKGNIIYITPGVAEGAQVISEPITMKYIKAADAQNLLRKVLTPKGDIKVDEISNMLIVTDYAANIEKLKDLLKNVDQPPQQVLIEAKIVDITSKDLRNLGVTWQADFNPGKGLFSRENIETVSERIKGTGTFAGPSSSLSGGQFKLDTLVLKGLTATATLDALIQDQKAHLLASPSIAVLNNREARIIIGEKVPYKERTQTTTGTTETTKFIDVGTTLRVTPSINADGYITLNIHPEVSSVSALLDAGPRITTREADTTVRVKEGETLVIGGLIKQEDNRTQSRLPILGYIPVLGYLFGNRSKDQTQVELTVFITPKILRSREEMLAEGKKHFEEEAYVNIIATASLNTQMKLFEKARNLQTGSGLESVRKEDWHRKRQAISIYESILTQFPDGPKAPESGYQAALMYYQLDELYPARDLCKKLISDYPDSLYTRKAKSLYRAIERRLKAITYRKQPVRLREEKRRKAEQQRQEERKRAQLEAQRQREELARQREEARKRSEEEARKKSEEKARLQEEARQKAEQERQAQIEAQRKKEELAQQEEEKRRQVQEEAARKKAELARQQEEKLRKLVEEKQKRQAELTAEKQRRLQEAEQAQAKAKEEARKKSEEQAFIKALRKQEADKKAEEKVRIRAEKRRQDEELARQKEAEHKKLAEESRQKAEEQARLRQEERQKIEQQRQSQLEKQRQAQLEAQRKKEELARQRQEQAEARKAQLLKQRQARERELLLQKQEKARLAKEKASRAKEEARKKSEEQAFIRALAKEEARKKAEAAMRLQQEKRKQAEIANRLRQEERRRAELEAQRKKEELARQAAEARQKAKEAAARAREQARLKAKEEAARAKENAWLKARQEAARLKEEAEQAKEEAMRLREQVPW